MSEDKIPEFSGKIIEKDGKKVLLVKARTKQIVHPDGRKDVVIQAPSLDLINKTLKEQKENK